MGFNSIHIEGVEYVNVGQTTDKGNIIPVFTLPLARNTNEKPQIKYINNV